ncbi:MAG: transporter substrate-binding domain-containing protein, partial [Desulfobacteraceae bacterium]|nr:transporter substrate-binding domain-containing protein [Desulfobacteraceae bacterium]
TWQDKNDKGKITGFAVELLEMAFLNTKIKVESRYAGKWKRAQEEVKNGSVDILGGAYITKERKIYMDYILPYFTMDPTVIFVKKGKRFKFKTWEELRGLLGGAPIGNSYGEKFDNYEKKLLRIERVPTVIQGFKKLISDRNDYFVYGLYPGLAEAETADLSDKIEYLENSVISEGLYFTISKKSPCNCDEVKRYLGKKIVEFKQKNIPEKLIKKYLKIWKEQAGS